MMKYMPSNLIKVFPFKTLNVCVVFNLDPRASVWGRGETQGSPGLGRSILHSDWLTPYCLKITELDSWQWQFKICIFMILVSTRMFCKIIFRSKTFSRLHDLLSPWPVTKLKSSVDVSRDVSWQNKKRLLLFKL